MWTALLRCPIPSSRTIPRTVCGNRVPILRVAAAPHTSLRSLRIHRAYTTTSEEAATTSVPPSDFQVATTDVQHAEFVAQAKAKSRFEVSDREKQGSSQGRLSEGEGVSRTEEAAIRSESDNQTGPGSKTNVGPRGGTYTGKLSPTSSHLFKLIVPLPLSLHAALGIQTEDSAASPPPKVIDTAFLLHPSQPLSHVSRLILGSLPAAERDADVEFRAVSGRDHAAYPATEGSKTAEESPDDEGGPLLYERNPDGKDLQEVRWSTSTDLGDFIKQATLAQHFRIVLKPSWEAGLGQATALLKDRVPTVKAISSSSDKNTGGHSAASKDGLVPDIPELSLKILIPSFESRTRFLRKRLLYLTRQIAELTQKKKELDQAAHKGAQRIAVGGLMGLVGYWGIVFKLTFFSSYGWDVMEPVTYLSGLSTLICSYLFFLYHNREVSYSSVLDLSVSARQKALYEKAGLDVERWTEMVSEAKGLRREIQRVAQDYDYDWKGQLENLEDIAATSVRKPDDSPGQQAARTSGSSQGPTAAVATKSQEGTPARQGSTHPEGTVSGHGEESIDIDATIDEAVELEEQTRAQEKKRRHGKGGKGEVLEADKQQGENAAKKFAGREGDK